jgi:hypothetical protein
MGIFFSNQHCASKRSLSATPFDPDAVQLVASAQGKFAVSIEPRPMMTLASNPSKFRNIVQRRRPNAGVLLGPDDLALRQLGCECAPDIDKEETSIAGQMHSGWVGFGQQV